MSVAVTAAGGLTTGPPTSLFQIHARAPVSYSDSYSYDVTADGQRFLVNQYVKPVSVQPLNLVLNGTATR